MRWCWWICWWILVLPWWDDLWWWQWLRFPPPGGKFPRRNRFAGEQKALLPSFHLEIVALHPETFLLFFHRSNGIKSQKMGFGGLPGLPQVQEVHPGGRAPPSLWLPGGPLLMIISPIIFIYSKIILRKFSVLLELCRIDLLDLLLSGLEFQLPAISLFM